MLEDLTNSASDAKYNILNVKIAQNYITIMFVLVNLDILGHDRDNIVHISKDDLVSTYRKPLNYFVPQSSEDSNKYSFFPRTKCTWNSLPNTVKTSTTLAGFKRAINTFTIKSSYKN